MTNDPLGENIFNDPSLVWDAVELLRDKWRVFGTNDDFENISLDKISSDVPRTDAALFANVGLAK